MRDQISNAEDIPTGFKLLPAGYGFTDVLFPLYRRVSDSGVEFGIFVSSQHLNSMQICHGGVLMMLADITAASGVNFSVGKKSGSPTINLSLDFVAPARVDTWIESRAELVSIRKRFGFCSGTIVSEDNLIARFNGTFYLPHDSDSSSKVKLKA